MSVRARGRARVWGLWPVLVMPPAAFAVHQMRYLLAYGSGAGLELQRTGHSYLHSVVPWLVLLIGIVAGGFLRALGRAFAGQRSLPRYTVSLVGLWVVCSASLVAIFAAQEFLEGLFATGHPAGLVGIFGYGGWWAIPMAVLVGLVVAAFYHGAVWATERVAQRCAGTRSRPALWIAASFAPGDVLVPRLAPLAEGWSRRGPPR